MAEPTTWEDVADEEEAFELPLEAADLLPVRSARRNYRFDVCWSVLECQKTIERAVQVWTGHRLSRTLPFAPTASLVPYTRPFYHPLYTYAVFDSPLGGGRRLQPVPRGGERPTRPQVRPFTSPLPLPHYFHSRYHPLLIS